MKSKKSCAIFSRTTHNDGIQEDECVGEQEQSDTGGKPRMEEEKLRGKVFQGRKSGQQSVILLDNQLRGGNTKMVSAIRGVN